MARANGGAPATCFLGVDVGGTFTDLVFYTRSGELHVRKVPSTPREPGASTLDGIDELVADLDLGAADLADLHHTHSSTVATNALIERRGARVGVLVTAGFRDVFELQRLALPEPLRFDSRRPEPLVRRALVREVEERLDASGEVLLPLDEEGALAAARELRDAGVEVAVVCLLHSYRNAAHEERLGALFAAHLPELRVELSSAVWAQAREYERATLTAVNGYIRPTVEGYLDRLQAGLRERGVASPARVSRSNGGMELAATMRERPVVALLSGPAGGVTGAAGCAADAGWEAADLITVDVGGTSADIGVIRDGQAVLSSEEHIAEFPLLIPTVAVSSIGAGGGSEIWFDQTGALKVGPVSVGADPGPACYGLRETDIPALTDAFLHGGMLSPEQRLGARLKLTPELAERALEKQGRPRGWSAAAVADGAIQVAVSMMAAEASTVLARRGLDVSEFRMVAFGGAGPLIGALLAEEIYVEEVLVPPMPGALSAYGAARADLEGDLMAPVYRLLEGLDPAELGERHAGLAERVDAWLAGELRTLAVEGTRTEFAADMRYDGQGYDVTVRLAAELLERGDLDAIRSAFHRAHEETYGHRNEEASVWLNELRAHVVGVSPKPAAAAAPAATAGAAPYSSRAMRLRGEVHEAPVYRRDDLGAGAEIAGPAIVEQMDTTTIVPDGWIARVVPSGSIVLTRR